MKLRKGGLIVARFLRRQEDFGRLTMKRTALVLMTVLTLVILERRQRQAGFRAN